MIKHEKQGLAFLEARSTPFSREATTELSRLLHLVQDRGTRGQPAK